MHTTQHRDRWQRLTIALATAAIATIAIRAQTPDADKQARLAALKQSVAANQAALKTYSWVETTTIAIKGEVKKQEAKQCYYGADGKVQKTPLPGAAPAQKQEPQGRGGRRGGGAVKGAIVANKVEEIEEYAQKVVELVKEYVPPAAERIQAVEKAGGVAVQAGTLTLSNYFKPGDSLAISVDPASKKISSYNVASYVEKPKDDVVTLAVTFASLDDGTNYPQRIVLDMKAKQIQVTVVHSGYKKGK